VKPSTGGFFDLGQACATQKSVSAILLHRKQLQAAGVDSWRWGSYVFIFYLNYLIMYIYNYESWGQGGNKMFHGKK